MAKGQVAKDALTKIIVDAVGNDFVTIQDKKIYVWADDGGERVQIAISMTMPKTPIAGPGGEASLAVSSAAPQTFTPTELDPADKAKIEELKQKLGISD